MHFDNIDEYLAGRSFSNGLLIKLHNSENLINNRLDLIETLVKNKKVIHVGCADHIPLIAEKIKNNTWLHKRIVNASTNCIGIDINKDAITYIQKEFDYNNIIYHDLIKDSPLDIISNDKWDYLILGEILEHVDNPVLFLSTLKEKYGNVIDRIIITVPNAFDLINLILIRKNIEFINTDHRYWFTPYTLAKVGFQAGFKVEQFSYCQSFLPQKYWQKVVIKKFPMLRESILMVFKSVK